MIVKPQGWVILKFSTPTDIYYKVFSSWRGGYLDGDSWRLSSGSNRPPTISECGKYWVWPQKSGSCYHLPVNGEGGMSFYTERVLKDILGRKDICENNIDQVNILELFKDQNNKELFSKL